MLAGTDVGAGIEPYWNYQEQEIPGLGVALTNVGTGNLAIQTADVDIPETGLDLNVTRTYNSESLHDANGDDGSEQALFGNQWTNTYDAHLVFRSSGQISVYDTDGTRCDYSPNGSGGWTPCTGQYAQLEVDPAPNSCSYWWIKKDGTALWFYTPMPGGGNCFTPPGNVGRLYKIVGRNSNNYVTLTYSFVAGQPQTAQNITQMVATHSDGQALTMTFAQFSGINELSTITYPLPGGGQATIRYSYDNLGDLLEVDKPGNGNANVGNGVPAGDLPQLYGNQQPTQYACGPRASVSIFATNGVPNDGACIHFDYDISARLTDWQVNGVLNPQINGGYIQPAPVPTGWNQFYIGYFVYGSPNNPPCTGTSSGTTTMCDSNGHSAIWTLDSASRVTQVQEATGKSSPSSLLVKQTWDSNDNLISIQDPSGDETDYAYDSTGNLTALALPKPGTADVQGKSSTFRATTLFSYDPATNNLLAVCDPSYTDSLGKDWTGNPGVSDSLCPQTIGSQTSQGATVFQYDTSDQAEPFGRLSATYTPMGYQTNITYDVTKQGGDFGLPTRLVGSTFTQNDNSQVAQEEDRTYDAFGNIATDGNTVGTWNFNYDVLNRATNVTDPTGIISFVCYNADGSTSYTTTALQKQMDGAKCSINSTNYVYDADGDVTNITLHYDSTHGSPASDVTNKWYDGLDRLVQVELPAGANIDGGNTGKTRYLYDLSQQGSAANLNVGGSSGVSGIAAYGNLYKTQRCVSSSCTWIPAGADVNGNAFDALDRPTARYQYSPTTPASGSTPGTSPGNLETWTSTYDQSGQLGNLTTIKDPLGIHTTLLYDGVNRAYSKAFDDGTTPTVTALFDLDGRTSKLSSTVGSESYAYDYDGRLGTYTEGGSISDPATLTYSYYVNGWRSKLSVSDSSAGYNDTHKYDYKADGNRKDLTFGSSAFSWLYDTAGRETQQIDPQSGSVMPTPSPGATPAYSPPITIGAKVMQYDPNTGLLSTLTMPNGSQYQSLSYDAEANILDFGVSFWNFTGNGPSSTYVSGVSYSYDKRGELNQTQATAPSVSPTYEPIQQLQFTLGHPGCIGGQACFPSSPGVDANTGGVTNIPAPSQTTDPAGCSEVQYVSYDLDGRQNSDIIQKNGGGSLCQGAKSVADKRTYDAENHLTQDTCSYAFQNQYLTICGSNTTYVWGPSGHLSKRGTSTLHWDGNNLLFMTNNSHTVSQINVEKLAWKNSQGGDLVVEDRDYSGAIADEHTGKADGGLNVVQDWFSIFGMRFGIPTVNGQYPASNLLPSGPVLSMRRIDGYNEGLSALTFQGVRSYDDNTSQWTTPDAYQGDVDSPMSQMAYQWVNNNPIGDVDPSGYLTVQPIDCPSGMSRNIGSDCQPDATPFVPGNAPADAGLKVIATVIARGLLPIVSSYTGTPVAYCSASPSSIALPGGVTFDAQYQAGTANAWNLAAAYKLEGPGGIFNYQLQGVPYIKYRAAANFGLGVYAAGAGFTPTMNDIAISYILTREGHGSDLQTMAEDMMYARRGYDWARKECHKR